ncbi:hypothetical protein ATANTOWER_018438 [Ataeniobius toweri]|uniref:Uncharacterized protein n=1 Tax=Ataeniobius toweri TaxID=208326 RepID=A0ABU7AS68_9TELE|nr:hypothetical protein [Ataeniobius toweri]
MSLMLSGCYSVVLSDQFLSLFRNELFRLLLGPHQAHRVTTVPPFGSALTIKQQGAPADTPFTFSYMYSISSVLTEKFFSDVCEENRSTATPSMSVCSLHHSRVLQKQNFSSSPANLLQNLIKC